MRRSICIPTSLKGVIARALCCRLAGRILAFCFDDWIPSGNCRISTRSAHIEPKLKASIFWQTYEGAEIRFIERYLRRDVDVIELGSSIGVAACHIRKRQDPARTLICVEADSLLLPDLRRNLEANGLAERVIVLHRAIDYRVRDTAAWLQRGDSNIAGKVVGSATEGSIVVPRGTLSEILQEHRIGEYALVCDIEGSEAGIVMLDPHALRNCRQIIIELHDAVWAGRTLGVEEICRELCGGQGFTLRDRHGPVCLLEKGNDRVLS